MWYRFPARMQRSGLSRRAVGRGRSGPIAGARLFYRDGSGNLVAVEVKTIATFSLGRTTALFPAGGFFFFESGQQFAVSADDQRFLMIRMVASSATDKLIVVDNWFEELKAKSRK